MRHAGTFVFNPVKDTQVSRFPAAVVAPAHPSHSTRELRPLKGGT